MKGLKLLVATLVSFMFGLVNVQASQMVEVTGGNGDLLKTCVSVDGNTCKLTGDIVLTETIDIEKNIIIDLNGYSITPDS